MTLDLVPIRRTLEKNSEFFNHPLCMRYLPMTIDYFATIGYNPPWIGYYVKVDHTFVGNAGFKGEPVNGKVEIAYGTFEDFQNRGIGTQICAALVALALRTDADLLIAARTLPEKNFSTRILEKNSFTLKGTVMDPEDGEVWEWHYLSNHS